MPACSTCKNDQIASAFAKDNSRASGLQSRCRACQALARTANKENLSDYQKQYYLINKARIIARTNARTMELYDQDRDTALAISREYQQKNRTKIANRKKKQRATTKEAQRVYAKQYHALNASIRIANCKIWISNNRDRFKETRKNWHLKNPGAKAFNSQARNARKLNATPKWADRQKIRKIYKEAALLTQRTGIPHAVDHIIPLQSPIVCGLHCEANLQILTKTQNSIKHNKFPNDDFLRIMENSP